MKRKTQMLSKDVRITRRGQVQVRRRDYEKDYPALWDLAAKVVKFKQAEEFDSRVDREVRHTCFEYSDSEDPSTSASAE